MVSIDTKEMTILFLRNSTTNQHEPTRTTNKYRNKSSCRLCGLWLIILLCLSCKSAPKVPDMPEIQDISSLETNGVPLDDGASVYLIADVKEARNLINLLPIKELNSSQTKQMLDKTDFFTAALFPTESGKRFQLAAWGDYPSSGAQMVFGMNKNWKRMSAASGYSYWHSEADALSLSISARQAFAAASSNETPAEPLAASALPMPEGFADFKRGSPFSCWFHDGGSVINRILNASNLPIRFPVQELFIAFFPVDEGKYFASIRMQFENENQARGISPLLAIANNFIYNELGGKSLLTSIFFANKPVQSGRNIDLKTAVLTEAEIAQFLKLLPYN